MNKEVKKILEEKYNYDFANEFFTDDILLLIEEVIEATTLQLQQSGVVGQSEQFFCNNERMGVICVKQCLGCFQFENKD